MRVGLVGCGAVAERYHLPALMTSPAIEIVACVDPAIDRARLIARQAGARHVWAHHLELPGHIDAAVLAVPNDAHAPVAIDLLNAGVHVLVEKPMARTVAECDRMIAAAASTGAVLAVGHDFRHFPIAQFARTYLASGSLGEVRRVDLQQSAGTRWPARTAGVLTTRAGGGTLLSFGVHALDLLLWWFGDLRVVRYTDDAAGGVEAECACDLELAGGAPVHAAISRRRALRDTFIVECHGGTIEIGIHEPAILRLALPSAPVCVGGIPDLEFERAPLRTVFARQVADFIAAIEGHHPPLVGGAEGRRVVALVETCYQLRRPLRRPWDFPEAYDAIESERRRHAG